MVPHPYSLPHIPYSSPLIHYSSPHVPTPVPKSPTHDPTPLLITPHLYSCPNSPTPVPKSPTHTLTHHPSSPTHRPTSLLMYPTPCRGLRVRLGENDLGQAEGTEQERGVLRAFRHPAYDPTTLDNDLLLLQLDRPVRLSRAVQPLALPRSCARPGTSCLVSGWGTVTTPQGEAGGRVE
uniref:Peptidase S1 domain-containing protein n=1 Tax=Anas platyrhynchos platyrhynchos TaxID=8840 RepID=A0A493SXF0_ANAPP